MRRTKCNHSKLAVARESTTIPFLYQRLKPSQRTRGVKHAEWRWWAWGSRRWAKKEATHLLLPGESHQQRSLKDYRP